MPACAGMTIHGSFLDFRSAGKTQRIRQNFENCDFTSPTVTVVKRSSAFPNVPSGPADLRIKTTADAAGAAEVIVALAVVRAYLIELPQGSVVTLEGRFSAVGIGLPTGSAASGIMVGGSIV